MYLVVVELVVLILELLGLCRPLGRYWRSGRAVEDCIILCIVISLIASIGSIANAVARSLESHEQDLLYLSSIVHP